MLFAAIFVMYGVLALIPGLAAGSLALALRPWLEKAGRGNAAAAAASVFLPALILGWGALLALAYANFYLLSGNALDPFSLGVDVAILVIALVLSTAWSVWLLRRGTFARPKMRAWGAKLGWAAAGLLLSCFVYVHVQDRLARPIVAIQSDSTAEHVQGPNILMISVDTLRADHLSFYGYPRETSPFLKELAREGALFTQSRSQASWTRPSAASLITSLYPSTHGAYSMGDAISEEVRTLFEYAKLRGYRTAVFSANGNVSREAGFGQGVDSFYESTVLTLPRLTVLYMGAERVYPPVARALLRAIAYPTAGMEERTGRDRWAVRRFQEWVGRGERQPFLAYIHLLGVHAPYLPPPPYDRAFGHRDRSSASEAPPEKMGNVMSPGDPLPDSVRAEMIDRYDGLIRFCDDQIRLAVDVVRRRGLLDDTLVIVTADHGEAFSDHGLWGHGNSLYGELIRVPLVLWAGERLRNRYPEIPLGVLEVSVSSIDVMPTVLWLAGIDCPTCEGNSLAGLAASDGQEPPILVETRHLGIRDGQSDPSQVVDMYALKKGRYKLIYARSQQEEREKWEFYDLEADSGEERNLINGAPKEGVPLLREMRSKRRAALAKRITPGRAAFENNRGLHEELKALGYVQ